MIAHASKGIETDNEDDLMAQLRQAVHHGDGMHALALMSHMAKVGHSNEICNAFGIDPSAKNLRQVANELCIRGGHGTGKLDSWHNLGLDKQLVLSVFDDISRYAKQCNHWFAAEMVTSKHGNFEFRSDKDQQQRIFYEASKKGLESVLHSGNRLAFGEYYTDEHGQQAWRMIPGMMTLLKRKMTDSLFTSIQKGYRTMNDNLIEFIMQNATKELAALRDICGADQRLVQLMQKEISTPRLNISWQGDVEKALRMQGY
jgi:hypothetical protein